MDLCLLPWQRLLGSSACPRVCNIDPPCMLYKHTKFQKHFSNINTHVCMTIMLLKMLNLAETARPGGYVIVITVQTAMS